MKQSSRFVVVVVTLVSTLGCSGADETESSDARHAAAETVSASGTVYDLASASNETLQGVEVCVLDDPAPCVATDAGGRFTIEVAEDGERALTFSLAGYVGVIIPLVPFKAGESSPLSRATFADGSDGGSIFVPPTTLVALAADRSDFILSAQAPRAPGTGPTPYAPVAGATFTVARGNATGPSYATASHQLSRDLTATSEAGWAFFSDADPGSIEITVGGSVRGCQPLWAWASELADTIRIPARAGLQTQAIAVCE